MASPSYSTIRLTSILGFNCFLRFSRLLLKGFGLDCNWLKGIKSAVARSLPARTRPPRKNSLFFASFVEQFQEPMALPHLNNASASAFLILIFQQASNCPKLYFLGLNLVLRSTLNPCTQMRTNYIMCSSAIFCYS